MKRGVLIGLLVSLPAVHLHCGKCAQEQRENDIVRKAIESGLVNTLARGMAQSYTDLAAQHR